MKKQISKSSCLLLSFTLAGHNEQLVTNHKQEKPIGLSDFACLCGYSKPDTWEPRAETSYNCPVIDKRAILEDSVKLAWLSPMPCADSSRCKPLDQAGPMDFVNLADYLTWWVTKGARVGIVSDKGVITWSDGQVQPKRLSVFARITLAGLTFEREGSLWIKLFDKGTKVFDGSGHGADMFLDTLSIPTHA
jgi:hypothetical protein